MDLRGRGAWGRGVRLVPGTWAGPQSTFISYGPRAEGRWEVWGPMDSPSCQGCPHPLGQHPPHRSRTHGPLCVWPWESLGLRLLGGQTSAPQHLSSSDGFGSGPRHLIWQEVSSQALGLRAGFGGMGDRLWETHATKGNSWRQDKPGSPALCGHTTRIGQHR